MTNTKSRKGNDNAGVEVQALKPGIAGNERLDRSMPEGQVGGKRGSKVGSSFL